MGTINYKTSEFLTIGLLTMDFDEAKTSLMECYDDMPEPSDDEVYTYIYDIAGEDRLTVEQEFKKLSFSAFDVKIEPGYYEGFYSERKEEARSKAIEWQLDFDNHNYSYGELAYYQDYFERLGRRYGLIKEFKENAII